MLRRRLLAKQLVESCEQLKEELDLEPVIEAAKLYQEAYIDWEYSWQFFGEED